MKKVYLMSICLSLCLLYGEVSAQVLIGFRAGVNSSSLKASYEGVSVTTKSVIKLHGGIFADIPVSEKFSVQPELLYNQYGGKIDGVTEEYSMLSLPILAKVNLSAFSVYAGPQIDYLLSAKSKDEDGVTEDVKDVFKSTSVAGVLGAEYNFDNGILLGLRYQRSLSNVANNSNADLEPGGKITLSGVMVTLGYRLGRR